LRGFCLLHVDALAAAVTFDCTGSLEKEQQSIPAIATDNRFKNE
jgi:hypothetical protein